MQDDQIVDRGLVLLGCGKMGSAMLEGWLAQGISRDRIWINDPAPSDWLCAQKVHLNAPLPDAPAVVLIAVKPQMMRDALPALANFGGGGTLFVSVAAGTTLATLSEILGDATPIIRAMPNTPGAIGKGITAIIGNAAAGAGDFDRAEALLSAIGAVVRLETEAQIDAVTGVSGSGPAYVFHLIECLAAAGEAEGLPPALSLQLATATIEGAGALAACSPDTPARLRENVTSPNGTTEAGLDVLMHDTDGLAPLIARTVAAATARSKALARG